MNKSIISSLKKRSTLAKICYGNPSECNKKGYQANKCTQLIIKENEHKTVPKNIGLS